MRFSTWSYHHYAGSIILLGVMGTAGITSIRIRKKFQGSRIKNCQSFKKGPWTPKIQHPQKAWEIHHAPRRFWGLIPRDLRGNPFWCHVTEQVERVGDEHLKLQPGTWELEEKSWRLSILERTTTGKFLVGGFLSRHAWGTLNKWQSFFKSFSERKNCWSLAETYSIPSLSGYLLLEWPGSSWSPHNDQARWQHPIQRQSELPNAES